MTKGKRYVQRSEDEEQGGNHGYDTLLRRIWGLAEPERTNTFSESGQEYSCMIYRSVYFDSGKDLRIGQHVTIQDTFRK